MAYAYLFGVGLGTHMFFNMFVWILAGICMGGSKVSQSSSDKAPIRFGIIFEVIYGILKN